MSRRPKRKSKQNVTSRRLHTEALESRRVLDSTVVFNEIMYHPPNDESLEFIELHNQMAVDMDISSWRITGGVEFQLAEGTIVPSGGHIVIAKDPTALGVATGFGSAKGPYAGQLSNNGELLELRDRNDRLMDEIDYGDGGQWAVAPDGSGTSLAKLDPNTTSDDARLWSSSVLVGGTPGQRNFPETDIRKSSSDLVTLESSWRYDASDVFPGADWATADFDDSTWSSGQPILFAGNAELNEMQLEMVTDVAVDASSELAGFDREAAYAVDGSGLVGETHVIAPDGNMWLNQGSFGGGPADLAPEITFDLGSVRKVDHIKVWNYNEELPNRPELLSRGVSSADILVAGEDQNFSVLIANQAFDKGSGAQTDFSQIIDLGQVDARYIKFDIHGNFPGGDNNFVGLSEVQFFAVGDALQTELPLGASTYYYRTEFKFSGDVSTADLFLDNLVDDGAVFYLNGTEVYRQNIPAGPVNHGTAAASVVGNAERINDIMVPSDALVEGTNVLAVEVHQSGAADGDMVFGAELRVEAIILDPPSKATLVDYEEFWNYEATGADQGTAWREKDFDDSNWLGNAVGLVGYWPLNGDGDGAVGEDGTMVGGPQSTTDRNGDAGGALAFNGVNQSVNIPGGGGLDGADAGTISLWVKWSGTQDDDCCSTFGAVLARQSNGQFSDGILSLDGPNPATANVVWRQSGGPAPVLITGTSIVGDDAWHHIAVTFSPAGSVLYVDGVAEGTAQGSGMNSNTNVALSIGAWIGDGNGFSNSSIDEVAIWSNVLSASQIAALASQTSTPFDFDSNLQAAFFAGDARVPGGGPPGNGELPLGPTTYYFRKEFTFLEDPSRTKLFLDSIIDDGAIYYLNGAEIHRHNMPAGDVTFETVASTAVDAAEFIDEIQVPSNSLVTGRNVLAVEVHQAATDADTDMLFDATLRSATSSPLPTDFSIIPLTINETAAATEDNVWFEVVNHGEDALNLSGVIVGSSRGGEHTLTGPSLAPGAFHTISEADLGFDFADNDRVSLYSPDRRLVVAAAEIKNSLKGRSPDVVGPFLFPDVATPGSANSFSFQDDIVINEIMYHHRPQQGRLGEPATFVTSELVALDDVWRYNDSGEALPPDWHKTDHAVGGNWSEGPGLIGYQRFDFVLPPPQLGTRLPDPRTVTPQVTTFYFELDFNVTDEDLADVDHLEIEHAIDDGAIFYLNGREVHRVNMPNGPVTSSTFASQQVRITSRISDPFAISAEDLAVGLNRLSVEVHQDSADSDDIMFGARLSVARETDPGRPEFPYLEIPEEWIELYNRGTTVVDLTEWQLDDGIDFDFPAGTTIGPGEYLVVANDAVALREKYPEVADRIVGDFSRRLNNFSDRIVLEDNHGNPADVVEYFEGGQWPSAADGDGPSLELRDPNADNSVGLAWAASEDASRSAWRTYTYEGVTEPSSIGPDGQWREFLMGLLTDGEVLLDDISVVQDPAGEAIELIQNGSFETDAVGGEASTWRIIGNHRHSEVITDPVDPTNQVLRFVGTGATEHMHNHAETTLKDGNSIATIQNGQTYQISFRAKWVSGSGQLHTRLYFNRLARVNLIEQPEQHGTPGSQNSVFEENIGPIYRDFRHSPAVPEPNEVVTVSVVASDPDGVASLTLWHSVDGGEWTSAPMSDNGEGQFSGEIPGQSASSIVQFYVEGQDALGAMTTFPRGGRESRALYKVQDGLASDTGLHNLRIIVTPQDADFLHSTVELMSNDRLGATLIYNESEVFYDASVRLSGSERARPFQPRLSFAVRFNPDQLFRGVHAGITLDRSESTFFGQREHLYHHAMNHAGGLPSEYNDLFNIITPRLEHTGSAEAQLARYSDLFLDSQFENGSDGRLYEYELTYYPTTTVGGVEGRKLPQPDGTDAVSIRSQGPDREDYRWAFLNKSNRRQDDYSRLMEFTQAMGLSGEAFHNTIGEFMDVDQWLRAFAFSVLTGHGDNYGSDGAQHNLQLYVRPADQRVLFFPHDLDAFFGATRPLVQNSDLQKLIGLPRNAHMYYGHVNDMIETTFNQSYMERWTAHWGRLLPAQNFDSHLSQMVARSNFLSGEVSNRAAEIDFEITTADFTVDASEATVTGNGWVNVREIRLAGSNTALPTDWPTVTGFEVTVPVGLGANAVTLEAYDFQGELIGTDTITITSTVNNQASEFLRISEIHYNPSAPTASELAVDSGLNNDDFEFIEVQNIGGESINLFSISFTDGINYSFPSMALTPGERGVIVRDIDAFRLRYGNHVNVIGHYDSGLSNAGENLTLADATGVTIVDFAYDDQGGWPETADGVGASLELVDAATPPDQFGKYYRWQGSTDFGGSPGAAGSEPIGVVINEVLAHTDLPITQSDSIELLNTTSTTVDIGGWYLSDAGGMLLKFEIPDGTELGPGEYVVFDEDDFNPSMGVDPDMHPLDFALSGAEGDDVYLVIVDEDGDVSRFADDVHFGASANGESFGRVPDVVGLAPMTSLTLGDANSAPRVGPVLISEVHYSPGDPSPAALAADPNVTADDLEFLEVYNPTNAAVDLTEWRIRGGVDFDFEAGYSLAAGETLVLIPFNPDAVENANRLAAFRAHHDVDDGATILGGFAGQLSDSGERIVLQRPDSPPPEDPLFIPRLSEDELFYDNLSPWDTSAAGGGNSLNRSGGSAYGDLAGSWFASAPSPGTVNLDLPGDFTGDGIVNVEDINALFTAISDGNADPRFDLDGNNNVGQSDVVFLVENIIGTFMGDANLDGRVDAADLNLVGINWGAANVTGWGQGDFNGDGAVVASDLNVIGLNWLSGTPIAAAQARVPRAPLGAVVEGHRVQYIDAIFSDDSRPRVLGARNDDLLQTVLETETSLAARDVFEELSVSDPFSIRDKQRVAGRHRVSDDPTATHDPLKSVDGLFQDLGCHPERPSWRESLEK